MFRFFETLVDPYQPYPVTDTPPRRLWPFLKDYIRPFKAVFGATGFFSLLNAVFDTALIWYVGQVVDYLATGTPAEVWARHGTEILLVAAAILIGIGATRLPEWAELALGIPAILGVYLWVIWRWGFGPEDRVLFKR